MSWSRIWSKKAKQHNAASSTLEDILITNGYDVKYAKTSAEVIRLYVKELLPKLRITSKDSLLEVGSGAGAIAFPLLEEGIDVTGLDPCSELIDIASKAMPASTFMVEEAATFNLKNKAFDAVLSHGVFQFFPSEKYGLESFLNMISHVKKGGIVAITDLLDADNEEELIQERIRIIGEKDYQEKYIDEGLTHQFYHKDSFINIAQGHCEKVWIEKQFLDNATASYKYNVFALK